MQHLNIIIAVDGHSSTGKSSFAKRIAEKYGLIYIDTGALYRGIALSGLRNSLISDSGAIEEMGLRALLPLISFEFRATEANPKGELFLNGEGIEKEIRSLEVSSHVSRMASLPFVREYVDTLLRKWGERKGVIMDGRDIGTVVFPQAEIKIFMTADAKVRAQRRYDEMKAKGEQPCFEEVLENVLERDRLDENRPNAPLRKAEDALLLDNSRMTPDEQMAWIDKIISEHEFKN